MIGEEMSPPNPFVFTKFSNVCIFMMTPLHATVILGNFKDLV